MLRLGPDSLANLLVNPQELLSAVVAERDLLHSAQSTKKTTIHRGGHTDTSSHSEVMSGRTSGVDHAPSRRPPFDMELDSDELAIQDPPPLRALISTIPEGPGPSPQNMELCDIPPGASPPDRPSLVMFLPEGDVRPLVVGPKAPQLDKTRKSADLMRTPCTRHVSLSTIPVASNASLGLHDAATAPLLPSERYVPPTCSSRGRSSPNDDTCT
jgi:hypothetical protein